MAADLGGYSPHGLVWIPLGAIHDPALVAPTIAQALGVREASDRSSLQGLAAALRDRRLLLVLDNFEQVLAAAPFVAELLAACPGLKVLVTSRPCCASPVNTTTRCRRWRCPTRPPHLRVSPRPRPSASLSQRAAGGQSRLYPDAGQRRVGRRDLPASGRAAPGHRAGGGTAAALPPDGLLARLHRRTGAADRGPRDAPARQQTLQATIAWSYDLLDPAEQRLFRQQVGLRWAAAPSRRQRR